MGGDGNEVTCAPTSQVALVLFASWFLLVQSDLGGHGAKWKLRCSLGEGGASPVGELPLLFLTVGSSGPSKSATVACWHFAASQRSGQKASSHFLEYVEKAKKGDSNGIERLALTSGVVFGVRQGVQTGPLLPVGS